MIQSHFFQAGNSLIAVKHEPVLTKVLNPNVSYKPKQHIYRKTKLKIVYLFGYELSICLGANRLGICLRANCPRPETSRRL